jgi:1-acyl-sn-glycerol-3-phosphate acyltransferase
MAFVCAGLGLLPGRRPIVGGLWVYTRAITGWMRVCGVTLEVRGLEHLRGTGPAVVAAKHQSYGDAICLVSRHADLGYVIGDHLHKFPLIGFILEQAEAVVVDTGSGKGGNGALNKSLERLRAAERDVLIFPEGHLAKVGEKHRYRLGAWKLARELDRPVVPVATNLGLFWPRQEWELNPGRAVIEILPPIPPGEDARAFTRALEAAIETRTAELVAAGRGGRPA